jgi:translation initiation factor 2 alpha subunit (eIF-2alpha)
MIDLEKLKESRDNLVNQLATLTAAPKPTYSIAGRSVSWESYQKMLVEQIEKLEALIQKYGGEIDDVGYILTAVE